MDEELPITPSPEENDELLFVKQLGGAEDLMFGFGTTMQFREGEAVTLTKINAATIPYDGTRSVKDVLDELLTRS